MDSVRQAFVVGFLSIVDVSGEYGRRRLDQALPTGTDADVNAADWDEVWGDLRAAFNELADETTAEQAVTG